MLHARPHLSVHSRADDHSAVNGAAYRLGLKLFDHRAQVWRDHTYRKPGEAIVHADTIAPPGAPAWATDPGLLWNRVEAAERRKDAQVARDYRVPIPRGVSDEQAGDMARMLAQFIVQELHTPVSYAVHRDADKDAFGAIKPDAEQGFHAHLYFPTRSLRALGDGGEGEGGGFGGKLKQFVNLASGSAMTERLNAKWARVANLIAGQAGQAQTYDHRSYKRMGIARAPEPKLGQAATAMERRGVRTRKGDALRAHRTARATATTSPLPALPAVAPFDPFAQPAQALATSGVVSAPPPDATTPQAVPQPGAETPTGVFVSEWAPARDSIPRPERAEGTGAPASANRIGLPSSALVRPRVPTATVPRLTAEDWLQTPVGHEPLPVVGLCDRFTVVATAKASASSGTVSGPVLALVRAIEAALNALIRVGRAVWHLDQERKRYATVRLDNHFALEAAQAQRDTLRRATQLPKRAVRLSAAHRKRLAEIQTLDEEIATKIRLGASLDEQVQALGERMDPWRVQVKADRRHLKVQLADLAAEGREHVETLLEVATPTERPWIAMYQKRDEPQRSLQDVVDQREKGWGTKPALRPKLH